MSVNLSADVVAALKALAGKRGCSMTEVLRCAIGTEKFLDDCHRSGCTILIEDKRGRVRQLVIR